MQGQQIAGPNPDANAGVAYGTAVTSQRSSAFPYLRHVVQVIQLPHLADLFKRNYFAPGSLRMPDSPLVRKYLEMSNDVHMLEAVAGEDATVSTTALLP